MRVFNRQDLRSLSASNSRRQAAYSSISFSGVASGNMHASLFASNRLRSRHSPFSTISRVSSAIPASCANSGRLKSRDSRSFWIGLFDLLVINTPFGKIAGCVRRKPRLQRTYGLPGHTSSVLSSHHELLSKTLALTTAATTYYSECGHWNNDLGKAYFLPDVQEGSEKRA